MQMKLGSLSTCSPYVRALSISSYNMSGPFFENNYVFLIFVFQSRRSTGVLQANDQRSKKLYLNYQCNCIRRLGNQKDKHILEVHLLLCKTHLDHKMASNQI